MPLDKLMSSMSNNPALAGALGGAASGALMSAFTSKKSARKLLKAGGLVAVGGLAWKAYQTYRDGQNHKAHGVAGVQRADVPTGLTQQDFAMVVDERIVDERIDDGELILDALIAAAHADGHLTEAEARRIWQHALDQRLPNAILTNLQEKLAHPPTSASLAARATHFETRIEVYTASLMVIDEHCTSGEQFLEDLANRLQLPAALIEALHDSVADRGRERQTAA